MNLLTVRGLVVEVDGKQILRAIDLEISPGEVIALTGPNGSGKTSLARVLMGDPSFRVLDSSRIQFEGNDLLEMTIDERARAGLYVVWQNPVAIPGVKVFNLAKAAHEAPRPIRQAQDKQAQGKPGINGVVDFKRKLEQLVARVGLSKEYIARNVNEGFSGGEKKRLELLQLLLLKPKLAILDEIDSGLDREGREMVAGIVEEMSQQGTSFIIISHYDKMLSEMKISKQLVLTNGRLQARD